MARRSDHSRKELEQMLIVEGGKHMADVGFARFSAREVAKRIGYSIGTLYNVFGRYDQLVIAINTRAFVLWTAYMRDVLERGGEDRIRSFVEGYFSFAIVSAARPTKSRFRTMRRRRGWLGSGACVRSRKRSAT